jgi:hypothetical protein
VKRRLAKWLLGALAASICLLFAADFVSARYLRRKSQRYLEEIEEVRQRESAYRRPLVFGEPLDQNAAVWYRQALLHVSAWRGDEATLRAAVKAGITGYPTSGAPAHDRCAEARSARVRNALRSTRCDWELGFGLDDLNSFDHSLDAMMLANCLTVEGHHAAHDGDRTAAMQPYLEAVAMGCNLGMGNDVMCAVGLGSSRVGLMAIGQLVMHVDDDRGFLDDVARRLSRFEGRLPDGRSAIRRERLCLENATSLDELVNKSKRFRGLARIVPFRTLAAWRLWRDDAVLHEFQRASAIATREEGLKLVDELKRDVSGAAASSSCPYRPWAASAASGGSSSG